MLPDPFTSRSLARLATLALVATSTDCSGGESAGADSTAAAQTGSPAATTTGAAPDIGTSAMAGMDDPQLAGMNRSVPKDSNQAFLRMMSDHHEGLVITSDSAMPRLQGGTAKADANKLRQKQHAEQQRMLTMLAQQYRDSVTPMITPSNRAMIDSATRAPQGADADRGYYRQVIAHHREGISMAEPMRPHLTGEVKQMAEKSISDQRREIQEFERKAQGGAQ